MRLEKTMSVSAPTETDNPKREIENIYFTNIISQKLENSSVNCKLYSIDVFSQVKSMLDMRETLEYYGLSINSTGFVSCPFHKETTPSFKVYYNSYYCFGCGENGTVIDFVLKYFKLTKIEAVKKLNEDFRLNLPIGSNARAAMCRSLPEDKNLIEAFKEWEKRAFKTLSSYFKILRFYGEQIYINHVEYVNKYESELDNILFVENLVDLMIENTSNFHAQVEFYRDFGEVVSVIERKLNA